MYMNPDYVGLGYAHIWYIDYARTTGGDVKANEKIFEYVGMNCL